MRYKEHRAINGLVVALYNIQCNNLKQVSLVIKRKIENQTGLQIATNSLKHLSPPY